MKEVKVVKEVKEGSCRESLRLSAVASRAGYRPARGLRRLER